MCYIIFNGVDSRELGLIIQALPDFHRPARRVEANAVPGRSGVVMTDTGAYDLIQTEIKINCNGLPLRDLYKWLRGEGWLISSDEPDYMAYAYLHAQAEDSRFRALDEDGQEAAFDTVTVSVQLEPFLRKVDEDIISLSAPGVFDGQGSDPAMPVITLSGSGDITLMVNGASVLIDDLSGSITIDCEAGTAYHMDDGALVWMGGKVTLLGGWPTLNPEGQGNTVNWTGSVTGVTIQPQWRYI